MKQTKIGWVLLLLASFLLSASYSRRTPLFETPDEPSHFEVAAYIAAQRWLPPMPAVYRSGIAPTVSTDVPFYYAPPLYYLLAALFVGDASTADLAAAVIPNPNFARDRHISAGDDLSSKNMYVHTAAQRPPLADWTAAMRRARILSLLLGTLTVAGAIRLATTLWPDASQRKLRWVAVTLTAFNPTFLYISGGVTNDTLLITLSTWSLALMAALINGRTVARMPLLGLTWRELLLALLLGAGVLTKQSGFILWLLAGFTLLVVARQEQCAGARVVQVAVAGTAVALLAGGWWYVQNGLLYGDPLALTAHKALPSIADAGAQWRFLFAQLWGVFAAIGPRLAGPPSLCAGNGMVCLACWWPERWWDGKRPFAVASRWAGRRRWSGCYGWQSY